MTWEIDNIPEPPVEFQLRFWKEIEEARSRAIEMMEDAEMSVAMGYCKNHPERPCPSRGRFAGLCLECREAKMEEQGQHRVQVSSNGHVDLSLEKGLRDLLPSAKEIDKKAYELRTKKGVVHALESDVNSLVDSFQDAVRSLLKKLE